MPFGKYRGAANVRWDMSKLGCPQKSSFVWTKASASTAKSGHFNPDYRSTSDVGCLYNVLRLVLRNNNIACPKFEALLGGIKP